LHASPRDFRGNQRFEVLAKLGAGATGVVYAANDRETGGSVALKVLKNLAPESIAEFKQEFRAIADLEHPNLVRLGELIAEDDHWLFTMELVEGVDFLSFVRPDGVAYPARIRAALLQLVLALGALHDSGQVHRDVKPSNVLVRDDGNVKLLDFGLVTHVSDEHDAQPGDHAVGTTAYVAPEQAAARAVTAAADFYAVGVMLYEALTGVLPFDGPPLKVLMDKQTQRPRPPHELEPEVDRDLSQLCVELLAADAAQRPSATRIAHKLRGKRAKGQATTHPTRSHAFFGRSVELDALVAALLNADARRSRFFLVLGSSGIGKSGLINRAVRRLASHGALVLSGRCRAQETVPYRALDGVIDELAQHLSRLPRDAIASILPEHAGLLGRTFPALSRVDAIARAPLPDEQVANPLEQRRRAFSALRGLLVSLTRKQPVVIAVDDLHFADADSLSLLRTLVVGNEAAPIGVLCSANREARGTQASEVRLDTLRAALPEQGEATVLEGLDEASAIQLAQHLLDLDPIDDPPPAHIVAREGRGHPRLIEELVQHLKEHPFEAGRISMEDVIRTKAGQLPTEALHVVALLAIAGNPMPAEVLRHAASLEPSELSAVLTRLRLSRLVRSIGVRGRERLELCYERIREAVLAQVPEEQRAIHHRALALAYEAARSEDYEELSLHWAKSGVRERAAEFAAKAADEALVAFAFERAAQLYQQAVELSGDQVDPALHARHGDALVSAGRGPEGARAYLAAARRKSSAEAIDLRRRAAEQLMTSGHAEEGLAVANEVMSELSLSVTENPRWAKLLAAARMARLELRGFEFKGRDTSEIAARDLVRIDTCWTLFVGFAALEPTRAPDPITRHLLLALAAGEPYRVGRGLSALSTMMCISRTGMRPRAQELAERAEAIAERLEDPHLVGLCQLNAGLRAFHGGDLDAARVAFDQAERTFQEGCRGAAWEIGTTHFFSLLCRLAMGDVATLSRLSALWHEEARVRGDLHSETNLRVRVLPAVALVSGKPDRARRCAEPAVATHGGRVLSVQDYWRGLSLADCDLYEGATNDALARVQTLWPVLEQAGLLGLRTVFLEAWWLRARTHLAAYAQGVRTVRVSDVLHAASRMESVDTGGAQGLSLAIRAGLAEARNEHENVLPAWKGAEAQLRSDGRQLLAQLARLRRGLLGSDDDAARARREARTWLIGAGVAEPERLMQAMMPGPVLAHRLG
jgi:tRNA A-37 threonylcarbamoyl transferase component Bud32